MHKGQHESPSIGNGILTYIQKLDKLELIARNHNVQYERVSKLELIVIDEVFVIATKRVRIQRVDISDWSTSHFLTWIGY
jgi:hypothetical protein